MEDAVVALVSDMYGSNLSVMQFLLELDLQDYLEELANSCITTLDKCKCQDYQEFPVLWYLVVKTALHEEALERWIEREKVKKRDVLLQGVQCLVNTTAVGALTWRDVETWVKKTKCEWSDLTVNGCLALSEKTGKLTKDDNEAFAACFHALQPDRRYFKAYEDMLQILVNTLSTNKERDLSTEGLVASLAVAIEIVCTYDENYSWGQSFFAQVIPSPSNPHYRKGWIGRAVYDAPKIAAAAVKSYRERFPVNTELAHIGAWRDQMLSECIDHKMAKFHRLSTWFENFLKAASLELYKDMIHLFSEGRDLSYKRGEPVWIYYYVTMYGEQFRFVDNFSNDDIEHWMTWASEKPNVRVKLKACSALQAQFRMMDQRDQGEAAKKWTNAMINVFRFVAEGSDLELVPILCTILKYVIQFCKKGEPLQKDFAVLLWKTLKKGKCYDNRACVRYALIWDKDQHIVANDHDNIDFATKCLEAFNQGSEVFKIFPIYLQEVLEVVKRFGKQVVPDELSQWMEATQKKQEKTESGALLNEILAKIA